MSLVIDASLTMTWYFEDEATAATEALLDVVAKSGAVVPPLWRLEVASGFQSGIRRKRIDAAYRDASMADLGRMPITVDPDTDIYVWTTTLRTRRSIQAHDLRCLLFGTRPKTQSCHWQRLTPSCVPLLRRLGYHFGADDALAARWSRRGPPPAGICAPEWHPICYHPRG